MYIVFVFLIGQEHSYLFDFKLFNTRWTFPYQNYFFCENRVYKQYCWHIHWPETSIAYDRKSVWN